MHDGPGVRTTVFVKGCPLRCAWCHNPESQNANPELLFWSERCVACGACAPACPSGAIAERAPGATPETDRSRCTGCGACAEVCVPRARTMVGAVRAVGDLLAELDRDALFYDESGGGVTLSGGEPLAQPEFSEQLLAACRERKIHTALDTCGHADAKVLDRVAEHVDLFLYDIKLLDDKRHLRWTGASSAPILANLRRLSAARKELWIRYPLIPGVNDSERDLVELSRCVSALSGAEAVQILPYHAAGERKFAHLGRPYGLPGLVPPDPEAVERAAAVVHAATGLPVTIGG